MARIAFSKDFLSQLHKLGSDVQKKVAAAIDKFEQASESAGLNLEGYNAAADPRARTIRIDKFWRAILAAPEDGSDTYILFAVKPHDQADRWMQSNKFSVNALTQGVEVIDEQAIKLAFERNREEAGTGTPETGRRSAVLAEIPAKSFRQLGIVDENLIGLMRSVADEDQLLAMANLLPDAQSEALLGLMCGDPVEEIYARLLATEVPDDELAELEPVPDDLQDLGAAVESHGSRSSFRVVDGSSELASVLTEDFEAWRTFLHPAQTAVVEKNYKGPARITGGAGTGKTVALLHRAKRLALEPGSDSRILITTFTNRLVRDLHVRLRELGGKELTDRVSVSTVDSFARRQLKQPGRILGHWELLELANDAEAAVGLDDIGLDARFLVDEWEQVVLAQKVRTRPEYFQVKRTGRGVRLDRKKRAEVWRAIEQIEAGLAAKGKSTFLQVADDAADRLVDSTVKPFDHILVDESQDLHPAQWRLLRAAVAEGENDLFIAGDAHQRIYGHRVVLSRVGINVRGRSSRLKLNYRTTRQILDWSLGLLTGQSFDDMDDGEDSLLGYRSATEGPKPEVAGFPGRQAELSGLVKLVKRWRADGIEAEEIGVCARTNADLHQIRAALDDAGIPSTDSEQPGAGVTVETMHKMKGLEYRCVAMVDVSDGSVPPPNAIVPEADDPIKHAQDLQQERCLIYVAATRAREQLHVSYEKEPSPLLHSVIDPG